MAIISFALMPFAGAEEEEEEAIASVRGKKFFFLFPMTDSKITEIQILHGVVARIDRAQHSRLMPQTLTPIEQDTQWEHIVAPAKKDTIVVRPVGTPTPHTNTLRLIRDNQFQCRIDSTIDVERA
jgi:hypothetical protein